ncbi:MAG TPA: DUF2357 domain-containing protein [Pseudonocardiaceae bacterium]|nr:DUF2357 domain-containing protein [Pseudonocardiaceae bacterium]
MASGDESTRDSGYDRFAASIRPMVREPLIGQYAAGRDGSGEQLVGNQEGRPDDLVLTSVTQIGDALLHSQTVAGWLDVNMFVQDVADRADLNKVDLAVLNEIDALNSVCWQPHDRLDTTTELVRAAQARRVPPAGLTRLAAHPDELVGVEHGRVLPLRLLSMRYVEQYDFYENRVAAQMVDRLREYLARRINELTELADGLANIDEYEQALHHDQLWRRRDRLAVLLSKMAKETRGAASTIQVSLDRLKKVRDRVLVLRGSPAYRHANRRVRLSVQLTRTNLFTSEARYRRVGALWAAWAGYDMTARQERKELNARFLASYDSYVAALVVRACRVLGFEPVEPTGPTPVSSMRLSGQTGELTCVIAPDGAVQLWRGNGGGAEDDLLVRVLAIGHDLSAPAPPAVLDNRLDRLDRAIATSGTDLVVVYPGLRSNRADLLLATRRRLHSTVPRPVDGRSPGGGAAGPLVMVVPASPVEIESEERLARALRWMLHGVPLVRRYPPRLPIGQKIPAATAPWLKVTDRDIWLLSRPSIDEQAELMATLKPAGRSGTGAAPAWEHTIGREIQNRLAALANEFALFETCPLCHKAATTTFRSRGGDTFECECTACRIVWFGTRVCGNCTNHYPVLWPGNKADDTTDADIVTMVLGADILSMPCVGDNRKARFQCPWCRYCGGKPECRC